MSTIIQEQETQNRGPTFAFLWHKDTDCLERIAISYTGRFMPWRRASRLSPDERARVRRGEHVVIGGGPPSHGTTWREVVYHRGRYRTRIPSTAVVDAVECQVESWHYITEGWRRAREGVKEWDEITRMRKLIQYGPRLLAEFELPTEQRGIDYYLQLAYKWDNHITEDD